MRVQILLAACVAPTAMQAQSIPMPVTGPAPALPDFYATPPVRLTPKLRAFADGETPIAPSGLRVTAFARGFGAALNAVPLPNGDVLVAQSGANPRGGKMRLGRGSDCIYLLRDRDGDGVAEFRSTLLSGLKAPYGMAIVRGRLYVAENDRVVSVPFLLGQVAIPQTVPLKVHVRLPTAKGELHLTRNLVAAPDGQHLFVAIGAASDAGQRGRAIERQRANILELNIRSNRLRVYAAGLRNPVGMAFEPDTGMLWTAVNERNGLGDELVPDYLTSVRRGQHFGWPFAYFGAHQDARYVSKPPVSLDSVAAPDFALGGHVAALGLAFGRGTSFPARYRNGAFVARHGSTERSALAGYDVVFVPFNNGGATGSVEPFLTGFIDGNEVRGRPRATAVTADGSLLVVDDAGDVLWKVADARADRH
ncbi:PQQ-dependent sugar dehydrogenase [Sphingomonas sp. R86520]|uniref:PQQ-dependent sugar dehydrogenase n=1 Tax=Sphingomonas sp. R86520 TaxID=3093859 RepID=UPI0036D36183